MRVLIMRPAAITLLGTLLLFFVRFGDLVDIQDQDLRGPILVGQALDPITYQETGIVFQDVGNGRIWTLETPRYFDQGIDWTEDGCKVLLPKSDDRKTWVLLSISDLASETLSESGVPIWSLDGQSIFIFQYYPSATTRVYMADAHGQNPELLRSTDEFMGHPQWLSDEELLYLKDGYDWLVWNIATDETHLFYSENEKIPLELEYRDFYNTSSISPDHTMQAGYFDLPGWRAAFNDATEDIIQELKTEEPQIPGFDIYFLKEGKRQHIDVAGQFVKSLVWSPSNKRIAITTDYDGSDYGIFVYDVEKGTIQRIADAYADQVFGDYYPSWSHDETWLAFYTPEGYAIQNPSDGKRIQLDRRMKGHQLQWSPVMDYGQSSCAHSS
jgi:hypothetical protein